MVGYIVVDGYDDCIGEIFQRRYQFAVGADVDGVVTYFESWMVACQFLKVLRYSAFAELGEGEVKYYLVGYDGSVQNGLHCLGGIRYGRRKGRQRYDDLWLGYVRFSIHSTKVFYFVLSLKRTYKYTIFVYIPQIE